jgi:hypothetical protein
MHFSRIFLLLTLALFCCKKKQDPAPAEESPVAAPVSPTDTGFMCGNLPPYPEPFGWTDSTRNVNNNVLAFFSNPLNADELIVVVEGDAFGYNQMANYNLKTKTRKNLAALDQYLPSVNSKGWIVYSTAENNVFKIKVNGDSLTQLTSNSISHDAKWDGTGKFIYYLQDAYFGTPAKLIKATQAGSEVHHFPHSWPLSAPFRLSNKVILQKQTANVLTLVIADPVAQTEKELLQINYVTGAPIFFNYLTMDHQDENFYWSNAAGIFKCNVASLVIDTLFRSCENMIYGFPLMSPKPGEMSFTIHTIKPIGPYTLLREHKAMEFNTISKDVREVRIFN